MSEELENRWWISHQKAIALGRSASSESWFNAAVEKLAQGLKEHFSALPAGKYWEQASSIITAVADLCQELAKAAPPEFRAEFAVLPLTPPNAPELEWLWGAALAEAAVEVPEGYAVACGLVENREISRDAIIDHLAVRFASPDGEPVFEGLRQMVLHLAEHPEIGVYQQEQRGFLEVLKQWRSKNELASVWGDPLGHAHWHYEPLFLLRAIRQVDASRYLDLLEAVALPPAVWLEFGARRGMRDTEELLALLAAAPSCAAQDDAGILGWNGKITAPMLLEAALEGLEAEAGCRRGSAEEKDLGREAKEATIQLAAVLLEREDAWFLAPQWLGYLVRAEQRESYRGQEEWRPTRAVIDTLAEAMAGKAAGLAQVQVAFHPILSLPNNVDAMRQTGQGDGRKRREVTALDAFLVAVLLDQADARGERPSESPQLLELYQSLLIRRDDGLYTFEDNFPTWRQWSPALYYARLPNPAHGWEITWTSLSEQRRRVRHLTDDMDADDPSFFHACVGMTMVDWLLDGETRSLFNAQACWDKLFDAAFTAALSLGFVRARRWRHLLAKLFARLPHLFVNEEAPEPIANRIAKLGGDDELLAWCCAMVSANGVDMQRLALALYTQGIELRPRLLDFADWEERSGYRRPPSPLATEARRMGNLLGR